MYEALTIVTCTLCIGIITRSLGCIMNGRHEIRELNLAIGVSVYSGLLFGIFIFQMASNKTPSRLVLLMMSSICLNYLIGLLIAYWIIQIKKMKRKHEIQFNQPIERWMNKK